MLNSTAPLPLSHCSKSQAQWEIQQYFLSKKKQQKNRRVKFLKHTLDQVITFPDSAVIVKCNAVKTFTIIEARRIIGITGVKTSVVPAWQPHLKTNSC